MCSNRIFLVVLVFVLIVLWNVVMSVIGLMFVLVILWYVFLCWMVKILFMFSVVLNCCVGLVLMSVFVGCWMLSLCFWVLMRIMFIFWCGWMWLDVVLLRWWCLKRSLMCGVFICVRLVCSWMFMRLYCLFMLRGWCIGSVRCVIVWFVGCVWCWLFLVIVCSVLVVIVVSCIFCVLMW